MCTHNHSTVFFSSPFSKQLWRVNQSINDLTDAGTSDK